MWVEQRPKEGETVKVHLELPTETEIGVFKRYFDGRAIIDIGTRLLFIDSGATFFVWKQ